MDGMTKMWISFYAIGFMLVASLLISFARAKTRGVVKFILSAVAFVLLFLALLFGLISIL